jgi:hypothetical protein
LRYNIRYDGRNFEGDTEVGAGGFGGGDISSASAMMENVLREFKDNDFQLVFTSGEEAL